MQLGKKKKAYDARTHPRLSTCCPSISRAASCWDEYNKNRWTNDGLGLLPVLQLLLLFHPNCTFFGSVSTHSSTHTHTLIPIHSAFLLLVTASSLPSNFSLFLFFSNIPLSYTNNKTQLHPTNKHAYRNLYTPRPFLPFTPSTFATLVHHPFIRRAWHPINHSASPSFLWEATFFTTNPPLQYYYTTCLISHSLTHSLLCTPSHYNNQKLLSLYLDTHTTQTTWWTNLILNLLHSITTRRWSPMKRWCLIR